MNLPNTHKSLGFLGLLTSFSFITGFISLFVYNPQSYIELNNLSLASYNLIGMNGQPIAAYINYIFVGLLNLIFSIGLIKLGKNDSIIVAGKIMLLLSSLLWISFGIVRFDPFSELSMHVLLIRTISILLLAPVGLLIIGAEFERIIKNKVAKYFTVSLGLIILFIGSLSAFVFNDQTWIRTNISIAIYFIWFGIIGLSLLRKPNPD